MNFSDWFDPDNREHLRAHQEARKTGYWPKEFIKLAYAAGVRECDNIEIALLLADRYCEQTLTLGAKEPIKEKAPQGEKAPEAVQALKDRYVIDDWWRSAWLKLANKREPNRLESKQEYICKRSAIANRRIAKLLDAFDALPIKEKEG